MTEKRVQDADELRWIQTQKALESVEAGQYIDENSIGEWLESWTPDNNTDSAKQP
ncbi:MAG: hypothetical protein MJK04_24930 [Psychrosphaera sp.]|nr:hypothetical protein [Psychrosphaera sp.]